MLGNDSQDSNVRIKFWVDKAQEYAAEIERLRRAFRELVITGNELCELLEYYESEPHDDSRAAIEEFQRRAQKG